MLDVTFQFGKHTTGLLSKYKFSSWNTAEILPYSDIAEESSRLAEQIPFYHLKTLTISNTCSWSLKEIELLRKNYNEETRDEVPIRKISSVVLKNVSIYSINVIQSIENQFGQVEDLTIHLNEPVSLDGVINLAPKRLTVVTDNKYHGIIKLDYSKLEYLHCDLDILSQFTDSQLTNLTELIPCGKQYHDTLQKITAPNLKILKVRDFVIDDIFYNEHDDSIEGTLNFPETLVKSNLKSGPNFIYPL